MEVHEAANIFPMGEETIAELAEDIRKNGQAVPIERWNGKLLDGRRRLKACGYARVAPIFRDLDPAKVPDPVAYVLSLNFHRRNLTTSQKAMVGARAREIYDREARERQKAAGGDRRSGKVGSVPVISPEPYRRGDSRDMIGKAVGVGGSTIDAATKVLKEGTTEQVAAVESGKASVYTVAKEIENPEPEEESGAATEPTEATGPNTAAEPLGVGIYRANEAIDVLKRIPRGDGLRRDGFKMVSTWIKHNL